MPHSASRSLAGAAPVTVAVISWNSAGDLGPCLRSVEEDVNRGCANVVVVDNASDDGSAVMVEQSFPWAVVIRSERNLGFGAAANLAFQSCASPWFGVANPDVELRPGAISSLLSVGETMPQAGILAPGIESSGGGLEASTAAFPRLRGTVIAATGMRSLHPRLRCYADFGRQRTYGENIAVEWALGALLLFRSRAFHEFGGFDEQQWLYGEDLEVCWRAAQTGWKVVYVPEARVFHRGGASSSQVWTVSEVEIRKARARYSWICSRRGRWRANAIVVILLLGAGVRLGVWTVARHAGVVAPARVRASYVWFMINVTAAIAEITDRQGGRSSATAGRPVGAP